MTTQRVVWCDFGGVLTEPIPEVLGRFSEVCGVPVDPLLTAINAVASELGMTELEPLERGKLEQAEWGRRVTEALSPDWTPSVDLARFGDYWYADRRFNRPLFLALAALRGSGLRLGLLTNSVREWEPFREQLVPDATVFDLAVRSHEIGWRKPDREIYAYAERLSGSGTQCILIDDSATNCVAAEKFGWRAIQHTSTAETCQRLDAILAGAV